MITGAYKQAQLAGIVTSATKSADLTPYMNYIALYTSGNLVDTTPTSFAAACSTTGPCLKLHNGGMLWLTPEYFNGTSDLNAIQFRFDPDGYYSGLTMDSAGVSVQFELYYNGFLTSRGQAKSGSMHSGSAGFGPDGEDPSWFSW